MATMLTRLILFPIMILVIQLMSITRRMCTTIADFLIPWNRPRVVRTAEDRFKNLEAVGYTFKPNYVELPIGGGKMLPRVHYVDEGPRDANETILCLHGEPSWSFLYRQMIHTFVRAGYRVIAPDFIGFGKSDKYTHPQSYTHDLHTQTLRLLLDRLNVQRLTLVCQDWGGLTGLTTVKDSPHFFSRLVIMNTGLPVGASYSEILRNIQNITPFLLWRSIAAFFGTYLPIRRIFKRMLKKPSEEVLDGYCAPFPSNLYKAGAAQWPLLVPITANTPVASEMQEARDFLASKWKQAALIMFSDRDPITHGELSTFQKLLPNATIKTVVGAGHYLQEDNGEELANNVISFIENKLQ